MFTKWDTWKKLHPNSKVLSSGRGGFLASLRDPYESYYRSTDTGIIPTRHSDKRIYPKEYVLGLVLNDPVLYRETAESVASIRKFIADLEQSKGLMGALINDPAFKAQFQKTLAELEATFANLKQASGGVKEAAARLPELAKKTEMFLDSLNKAGASLPDLVDSGQGLVDDADKVAKAAQKSWLLRKNVPKPKEHTIRMERDPGRGGQ